MFDPHQFLQVQKRVLEDLFGLEWFDSSQTRDHPAYGRWVLCNEMLEQGARIGLENRDRLSQFAELLLDNYSLVQATGGQLDRFQLGILANYGDPKVETRIRAIIHEPRHFLDLLVELSYAAWHLSRGNEVRAFEAAGHPDFEVVTSSPAAHFATDCKRVQAGTSENRFRKLVNKANKQIKNLGALCHGLVVVDISERTPQLIQLGDSAPSEIDRVARLLQHSMQTDNTTVSGALITWRDTVITPMTDGSGGTLCALRQHSRIVRHSNPLRELPADGSFLRFGHTVAFQVLPTQ